MDATAIKANFEARQSAVAELRKLDADAAGKPYTDEQAATEKRLNDAIDAYDGRITNGLAAIERDKKSDEARAEFEKTVRPETRNDAEPPLSPDAEKLRKLVSGEVRAVDFGPERRDLLKTGTAGSSTVPATMYSSLHEIFRDTSTMLQAGATVLNTAGGEAISFPEVSTYSVATIVNEAAAIPESDPTFTTITLDAYKYGFMSQLSSELIQDSAFDLLGFLARQGGVSLALGMNAHFVAGTGTGQPRGVDHATVGKTTAINSAITADELIDLYYSVPQLYRDKASWLFKDATIASFRKLKDTTGQYLWQPGLQLGVPDSILGRPVYTDGNLAAVGTTNVVAIFGDMSGYYIRFAGPVRIERSDEFAFANDLVTFRFLARADGDIVDTVGIRTLKMAV